MSAHHDLFGLYVPGRSVIHRMPVGATYLLLLALTVPPVLVGQPAVTLAFLAAAALALAVARLPWRTAYRLPWGLVILLATLAGYHLLAGTWSSAITAPGAVLIAVYAGRLLTCTTPGPQLLDALVSAARPLRPLGVDPERFGLAVALMVRSVPYLLASFTDVRAAARARGLERNLYALVTPVVVGAVAYGQATGEALAARGLGQGSPGASGPDADHG
ncbi:MAG: CbiQ family ECF transporter T component [Dermatophilaceae bacterium]